MKRTVIFLFLLVHSFVFLHAQQDKNQLEKEREELRQEMKEIEIAYEQLKGKKKQALGQLSLVQRKLNLQGRYVSTINRELRNIDDDLYLGALEVIKLQKQLDTLKEQYSRSIVYAYKNRSTFDYLNFIFSAGSFNDALKRIQYLKTYRAYREQQVLNMMHTQKMIQDKKEELLAIKNQKKDVLKDQAKQLDELTVQKKEKDKVMSEIRSQEKDFKKQLADKKKRDNQLRSAILAIVRREAAAAEKEAKAKAEAERKAKLDAAKKNSTASNSAAIPPSASSVTVAPKVEEKETRPKSYLDFSARDVALNGSFENNRGRLPWPVDKGNISVFFGKNKIDNLVFDNPGITIITPNAGMPVKSVFDGEVAGVYNLGDGMAITLRHGKYFTTYSNLSSVSVKKHDPVKMGQVIGRAAQAEDGDGGQIDFILMIETKNVNPQPWLHK